MRITAFVAILAGAVAINCGSGHNSSLTGPGGPVLRSLSLNGPYSVAPAGTAAFAAIGHMSDGTTQDYTRQVFWSTLDGGKIASISTTGEVTGRALGETTVQAAPASGPSAKATLLVLTAGTYRLTGAVLDAGTPLPGATVTVTSGTGSGLSTTTMGDGIYRLYGVAGNVAIQVVVSGYLAFTQSLTVSESTTVDFALTPATTRPSLSGTFAITISADSQCPAPGRAADALPAEVRERHYLATITQNGATFQATLSGENFVVNNGHGNNFSGTILGGRVSFQLGDGYYSPYPDLFESLGNGQYILIDGSAVLSPSGDDFMGVIDGGFILARSSQPWTNNWEIGSCYDRHPLLLTRQAGSLARIRR